MCKKRRRAIYIYIAHLCSRRHILDIFSSSMHGALELEKFCCCIFVISFEPFKGLSNPVLVRLDVESKLSDQLKVIVIPAYPDSCIFFGSSPSSW